MKRWTLTQNAFDEFLSVLDPDREAAGYQYQLLRARIVKFFEWRASGDPEGLADEAFDRVIRKISDGEQIRDVPKYLYGVAKLVFLESAKLQHREEAIVIDFPARSNDREHKIECLDCLEKCLKQVSAENRDLILRYYSFDRQTKIDDRKCMAEMLGLSINALRIKALRIRAKVEDCVRRCIHDL